jgi:hypothetical protein
MEFREMVDIFRAIKLKLNLHEYKMKLSHQNYQSKL